MLCLAARDGVEGPVVLTEVISLAAVDYVYVIVCGVDGVVAAPGVGAFLAVGGVAGGCVDYVVARLAVDSVAASLAS